MNRPHPRGMTLIELMLALALGLILIAGVVHLFVGSRSTYTTAEALARVQENGRFAHAALTPALREAGTAGFCWGSETVGNHTWGCPLGDLCQYPLAGWEYPGTGPGGHYTITSTRPSGGGWQNAAGVELPDALHNRIAPGTDVIYLAALAHCPESGGDVNGEYHPLAAQVYYVGYADQGDCTQPALVGEGDSGECGEPGLWRVDFAGTARREELVRGVENLQLLYGLSRNGRTVDQWHTATEMDADAWSRVLAVHIALIVRSPANAAGGKARREFQLAATGGIAAVSVDHAQDHRLRQAFEVTVALRNQVRR